MAFKLLCILCFAEGPRFLNQTQTLELPVGGSSLLIWIFHVVKALIDPIKVEAQPCSVCRNREARVNQMLIETCETRLATGETMFIQGRMPVQVG